MSTAEVKKGIPTKGIRNVLLVAAFATFAFPASAGQVLKSTAVGAGVGALTGVGAGTGAVAGAVVGGDKKEQKQDG